MEDSGAGPGTGSVPVAATLSEQEPRSYAVAAPSTGGRAWPRTGISWAAGLGGSFDVAVARRMSHAADGAMVNFRTGSFDNCTVLPSMRASRSHVLRERIAILRRPQAVRGIAMQFAMPVLGSDLDADRPLIGESDAREQVQFRLFQPSLTPLLQSRFGWYVQFSLVVLFLALDSSRYMVDSWAIGQDRKNAKVLAQALVLMQSVVSFASSLVISVALEGMSGLKQAFEWREVAQCLPISVGFSLASACTAHAYSAGLGAATAVSLGFLYMPLCALLSRWIFRRAYGWLDIQALALLTLSSLTFAELRGRAMSMTKSINGAEYVAISVVFSCLASLASEWSLKAKYNANIAERFYLQKVRLEFWGLFTGLVVLKLLTKHWSVLQVWEGWDYKLWISLCVRVAQSWLAMVIARHLSSLAKAVIQCLSLIFVFFIGDLVIADFSAPLQSMLVLSFLAVVVSLSALLYQMGRARTVAMLAEEALEEPRQDSTLVVTSEQELPLYSVASAAPESGEASQKSRRSDDPGQNDMLTINEDGPHISRDVQDGAIGQLRSSGRSSLVSYQPPATSVRAACEPDWCTLAPNELDCPMVETRPSRRKRCLSLRHGLVSRRVFEDARQTNPHLASWILSQAGLVIQVGCVVFFIISDASRTIINEWALGDAKIVQQSIVVAMAAASIVIGLVLAFIREGWAGVREALSPCEALRFLPVSAVFSIGQTSQIYAYGFGITAVENTVIGYFYMPLSAFLSRLIFKRYYSLLEWLALVLLMLSATAFVLMQGNKSNSGSMNTAGILCVCGSVVFSCLGSVLAEKFMKKGDCAFYIQKVQLEVGDLVMACVMLVVTGAISTRDRDAFWRPRDVGGHMESGVFAGWNVKILIVLLATLMQSWLGGLVAKQLSTVIRAVAQCLSLLLIYFIGDLVLKHVKFDWPQGTMAVVVALTVQVFVLGKPRAPAVPDKSESQEASGPEEELELHEASGDPAPAGLAFARNPAAVPLNAAESIP